MHESLLITKVSNANGAKAQNLEHKLTLVRSSLVVQHKDLLEAQNALHYERQSLQHESGEHVMSIRNALQARAQCIAENEAECSRSVELFQASQDKCSSLESHLAAAQSQILSLHIQVSILVMLCTCLSIMFDCDCTNVRIFV